MIEESEVEIKYDYQTIKGGFPRLLIKNKKLDEKKESTYQPDINFFKELMNKSKKITIPVDIDEELNIIGGSKDKINNIEKNNKIYNIDISKFID